MIKPNACYLELKTLWKIMKFQHIMIGTSNIKIVPVLRNLGVYTDSNLTMKNQILAYSTCTHDLAHHFTYPTQTFFPLSQWELPMLPVTYVWHQYQAVWPPSTPAPQFSICRRLVQSPPSNHSSAHSHSLGLFSSPAPDRLDLQWIADHNT